MLYFFVFFCSVAQYNHRVLVNATVAEMPMCIPLIVCMKAASVFRHLNKELAPFSVHYFLIFIHMYELRVYRIIMRSAASFHREAIDPLSNSERPCFVIVLL